MFFKYLSLILILPVVINCQQMKESNNTKPEKEVINKPYNLQKATFGAGCFWCVEAAFDQLVGVAEVQSGYAGGHKENPTYKEVCTIDTGHAEVIQVTYNSSIISYETLLKAFWTVHDPTQLNRQGNDVGTQYRSEIFYHNDEQKILAEKSLKEQEESGKYASPIVTKITALDDNFYPAEDYHTDYYELNKTQPYCSGVIAPKLKKFQEVFKDKLKPF